MKALSERPASAAACSSRARSSLVTRKAMVSVRRGALGMHMPPSWLSRDACANGAVSRPEGVQGKSGSGSPARGFCCLQTFTFANVYKNTSRYPEPLGYRPVFSRCICVACFIPKFFIFRNIVRRVAFHNGPALYFSWDNFFGCVFLGCCVRPAAAASGRPDCARMLRKGLLGRAVSWSRAWPWSQAFVSAWTGGPTSRPDKRNPKITSEKINVTAHRIQSHSSRPKKVPSRLRRPRHYS